MSLKARPRFAVLVAGVLLAALLAPASSRAQNGIFADFTTTKGSFTCLLDFTNAPRTVANFIGLATGGRSWLDLNTGRVRNEPFYDGIIFHRVIAGFMIQGGSPNGTGTDSPGYAIKDEFTPALVFTNYGVLAMANSGPNSEGAQFFITVEPYTSGNNTYSIFGRLTAGSNIVYAINHVATDANDKPLTNVVIQQVTIRRVGTAAQAFDANAYGLPVVTNLPVAVTRGAGQVTLTYSNRLYADNRFYTSTNFSTWSKTALGVETTAPTTNSLRYGMDVPQRYFRLAQMQYPTSTFAPRTLFGRTLILNLAGIGGITNIFNGVGGGTYTYGANSGTIMSYSWTQDVYRGYLWPIYYSGLVTMTMRLDFSSATGGTVSGTAYTSPFTTGLSGSFTLTGP